MIVVSAVPTVPVPGRSAGVRTTAALLRSPVLVFLVVVVRLSLFVKVVCLVLKSGRGNVLGPIIPPLFSVDVLVGAVLTS